MKSKPRKKKPPLPEGGLHMCPACGRTLAKDDPRKPGKLLQVEGTWPDPAPGEVPRCKCPCGMAVVFLKASL
jgi:hypothetical protein